MSYYNYAPILQEVQDACIQLNLAKPSGVYDSEDENAQIMGSFANMVGVMLNEASVWQQFVKPYSITGDSVRTAWDLAPDISRFRNDTGWSLSNRRPVIIINAQQWAAIQSWISQSFFVNPACRIVGDQLVFMTAPAAGEVITFEYITKNWVIDGVTPTTTKQVLTQNSDTPMHDSQLFTMALKLKWLQTRGMPTTSVQDEFNKRFLQLTSRDVMAQELSLNGGAFTGFRYLDNYWNTPDTNIGM